MVTLKKVTIWIVGTIITALIFTVIRNSGIILGGLPSALIFFAYTFICGFLSKRVKAKDKDTKALHKQPEAPETTVPLGDASPAPTKPTYYLMETDDGFMVRVPADKLDAWIKGQEEVRQRNFQVNQEAVNKIVSSIYGSKTDGDEVSHDTGKDEPTPSPSVHKAKKDRAGIVRLLFFSLIIIIASAGTTFLIMNARFEEANSQAYEDGRVAGYQHGHSTGYSVGYNSQYMQIFELTSKNQELEDSLTLLRDSYIDIYLEYRFFYRYAVLVTSNSGAKYHHYDCSHISDKSFYIYNIELAESKGYKPCADCWSTLPASLPNLLLSPP